MRDRDWLIPVAVIVAVQLLLWRAAYAAGIAYPPMFVAYGLVAYAFFVAVAGCKLFAITIGMAKYREPEPTRKLLEVMRSNWPRAIAALVGLQLVALGSAAFSAIKGAMPKAAPFWLDTPLMNVEASAGVHPWQVSHFLFGWATPLIDRLYATFVPVHMLAVFAVLATRPSAHKSRALVTLALSWLVVGICGAWALSSAGPIF